MNKQNIFLMNQRKKKKNIFKYYNKLIILNL